MKLYMMTTSDKYELPLAVADSPHELAEMVGVSYQRVYNGMYQSNNGRIKKHTKWHMVVIDDEV